MLQNAYLDAKIGVDPAENEPPKECCVVAGISLIADLHSACDFVLKNFGIGRVAHFP